MFIKKLVIEQEMIEEVPAYTWEKLFSDFGGCVGLMTGTSVLSIVEIIIFISLVVMERVYRRQEVNEPPP